MLKCHLHLQTVVHFHQSLWNHYRKQGPENNKRRRKRRTCAVCNEVKYINNWFKNNSFLIISLNGCWFEQNHDQEKAFCSIHPYWKNHGTLGFCWLPQAVRLYRIIVVVEALDNAGIDSRYSAVIEHIYENAYMQVTKYGDIKMLYGTSGRYNFFKIIYVGDRERI